MRKLLSVLIVLIMAVTLFAGGSKDAAASDESGVTTLRVIDWSDSSLVFREAFHKKFEENHPGVKVDYTCLTIDQFNNTIVTSVKSGDGPDLFPIPSGRTLAMALQEDWYQPLDPYFDEEFFASFDPASWESGVTTNDGKRYVLPENLPVIHSVIYYNKDVLDAAGITELPVTYSEFLDTCIKVSEAGKGRYYGWIEGGKQINRLEVLVRAFASKAGGKIAQTAKVLTVDGKAPYDAPEVLDVLKLFQELVDKGGMHPDTLNISAPEAREMFAQGQAAFLVQGMWCIPTWAQTYPDMNYGVMDIPVPDELKDDPFRYGAGGEALSPWIGIYSKTKQPELAAEYLKCLYSVEYGYQQAQVEAGNNVSAIAEINEKYMTNPVMIEYYEVARRNTKAIPIATKRDESASAFYAEVRDISPSLGNIFQGILSNSIKDPASYLKTLADKSTAEWKRASEAIGLDYGVFEFPNWDNTRDYTDADYAALQD